MKVGTLEDMDILTQLGYGGTTDLPRADGYGSYSGIQSSSIGYGAYEGYSLGGSGGSRSSGQDPASRRKSYGYYRVCNWTAGLEAVGSVN
ncbi:hypothetical protein MTR67_010799 [Solanum verrucosum]|uniref:Uncharacterized protein n=1 Tax=Solanum verrucosum TaxID=315347 RepID=A0AAF0Q5N3_SOLVR|nr:hypothetical protein MTR67_010799 [Solanum verrucosum]